MDLLNKFIYQNDMDGEGFHKISTIYVDMDGVLVDPYDPFSKYLGIDYETVKAKLRRISTVEPELYMSTVMPLLHEISSTDIFSYVRPYEGFDTLVTTLKGIEDKGIEIKILSSVMKDNQHADNLKNCKQTWLTSKGIQWEAIFVNGRHDKRVYSNKSSLLIDDTYSNIMDWKQNGGYGIYHTSHKNTINYLYDLELI